MHRKFTTRAILRLVLGGAALLLIPLTLGGTYVLMQTEFGQARELRATAEATLLTRDELEQLLIAHVGAEAAARGYVVTQDPAFLEPYLTGNAERERLFEQLETHLDATLQPQLVELRSLSDKRWANLAANIRDVREGRLQDAEDRIATGAGRRMMDEFRERLAALDAIELEKVQRLTAAGAGSRNNVERTVNGLMLGLGVLLLLVATYTARSMSERREALARSNRLANRQKAMFEGAVDPMLLLDSEGNILRMNPSVSRLFGYEESELLGRHNMTLMADDYTPEQSLAWLNSVGEAGAHGAGRKQEFTGLCKNGTTFATEVAISRFTSDGERQYVAAIRDISDRKRAETMKTEFVSTVSHELRTPLTSIGGSLGLLAAGAVGPLDEKAQRLVAIAHSNCERLIRLINDILDIEKIESGKMDFDVRRMQVAPLIRRTTSAMTGFADKHDVKLSVELPPWPQCIVGDPDRLEQLLTNLVSNAIKHSPDGSNVELFAGQDGGNVRIEVRDRGDGIPLEFRDRIFGKFAMADASDSRTKGGTGLGLSIAREIARRHGGDVGFTDRKGGGTVFFLELPLVPETPTTVQSLPVENGKLRVLHIDDDMDCLNVVASAFDEKAAVFSVGSLQQAVELVATEHFDAAIVDVDLRSDSGLDLLPALRQGNPQILIVLFTALDEPHSNANADKVLIKSRSSVEELVDEVINPLRKTDWRVA